MMHTSKKRNAAVVLTGCLFLLLTACSASRMVSEADSKPSEAPVLVQPFDHSHLIFDGLLKKYVANGLVDYRGLQSQPEVLARYVTSLGAVTQPMVRGWPREQQLAYWINAYNAFTLQAVVDSYPIESRSLIGHFFPPNSILQIPGIWNRMTFKAGGQRLTLGQIEHDILRKDFKDPRIHFAIVCASSSCPVLRSEAYRYDVLEHQLHDQTVGFINDPERGVRWDAERNRLYVSKIFRWFKADFQTGKKPPSASSPSGDPANPVLAFIHGYLADDALAQTLARNPKVRVSYLPYDWWLNEEPQTVGSTSENGDGGA